MRTTLLRGCKQPERVVVPQVVLGRGGYVLDIGQGFDFIRVQPDRIESVVVKLYVVIAVSHNPFQPLELDSFDLFA